MANVHHLRSIDSGVELHLRAAQAGVHAREERRCALCGGSLADEPVWYPMVSPLVSMGSVTVCRRCHRVALSEGYRPADEGYHPAH